MKIFSDNGGEFASEELTDFCENFNIKISTSAADSPWSNRICEWHNAILTELLLKIKEDIHCFWDVTLAWAFNLGQEVYYKRNNDIKWKGPGKVVGQDGPVVFIRHGGHYVKVHCSRIQLSNTNMEKENDLEESHNQINQTIIKNPNLQQNPSETIEDLFDSDIDDEMITIESKNSNISINDKINSDPNSADPLATNDQPQINDSISELTNQLLNTNINDQESSTLYNNKVLNKENLKLKKGQLVSYTLNDIPYTVEILGHAGKATGLYKNSFNVEYKQIDQEENKNGYVDFDKVDNLKLINIEEEKYQVDSDVFQSAKETELMSWKKNQVFEEVPYIGQKTISLIWVCTWKNIDNKTFPKARLVAKGFEENNRHTQRFSNLL